MDKKINRREFVALGIGTGWALAVQPITSWAITTSEEGLTTDWVQIPSGNIKIPAYRAMPKPKGKSKAKYPVVLVVQEIFGVHPYIQDVCRRLAKEGYVAIAPYLYFREGDVTKIAEIPKIASEVVSKVPQAQVFADLDATREFLKKTKEADTTRVSITGFCWGGNVVWTYSSVRPELKSGIAWYGRLAQTMGPDNPKAPVALAPELKVPVLGLYGGKDQGIPLDTIDKMKTELAKGKSGSEFIVYPEAEHGFHADYRPSYNEASAKAAWGEMLKWLDKNNKRSTTA